MTHETKREMLPGHTFDMETLHYEMMQSSHAYVTAYTEWLCTIYVFLLASFAKLGSRH